MATFVNLTPHALNIHTAENGVISVPPSGNVARVATSFNLDSTVDGIDIYSATYGEIEGLPAPSPDVIYIASGLIVSALQGTRYDVTSPGELVRDADGRPVGCKGLRR